MLGLALGRSAKAGTLALSLMSSFHVRSSPRNTIEMPSKMREMPIALVRFEAKSASWWTFTTKARQPLTGVARSALGHALGSASEISSPKAMRRQKISTSFSSESVAAPHSAVKTCTVPCIQCCRKLSSGKSGARKWLGHNVVSSDPRGRLLCTCVKASMESSALVLLNCLQQL